MLLIVDYADRWPLSHLVRLFNNTLLHQADVRSRILPVARTADLWPGVQAALRDHEADCTVQALAPLPEGPGPRLAMSTAARNGFASRYALDRPADLAASLTNRSPRTGWARIIWP